MSILRVFLATVLRFTGICAVVCRSTIFIALNSAFTASLNFFFFFYLGFLSRTFIIHRTAGEGGVYFFNSSPPVLPVSQTLRHYPCDYCRVLTVAQSHQPDSNREALVFERKSLTTKLRVLITETEKIYQF